MLRLEWLTLRTERRPKREKEESQADLTRTAYKVKGKGFKLYVWQRTQRKSAAQVYGHAQGQR